MKDLNNVNLIGRLTKDSELRECNGNSVLNFSVAYTTTRKDGNEYKDDSNYLNLALWGKRGETLAKYLSKGTQIAISGHLHQKKTEKDGQKIYSTEVAIDDIQLLGSGKKSDDQNESSSNYEDMPF